jgi:hypothetical protein
MNSIIQDIQQLKKKLNDLFCLLSNSVAGGGGGAETDPTVLPSIKTLTDEDVAKIKNLGNEAYIPLQGIDADPDKSITKNLFFSNYDYVNDGIGNESNGYYVEIGKGIVKATKGIIGNTTDSNYYNFNLDNNQINISNYLDYFGNYNKSNSIIFNVDGINILSSSEFDGTYSKGSSITIGSGIFQMQGNRSDSNNQTDYTSFIIDPAGTTTYGFFKGSTSELKQTIFSFEGIKTDTLPDVIGDNDYYLSLVQKADGTIGTVTRLDAGSNSSYTIIQTVSGFIEDDGGTINISQGGNVVSFNSNGIGMNNSTQGIVLLSPNNSRYKITVDNDGSLITTLI